MPPPASIIRIVRPVEKPQVKFCITLRQWSILFSILIFILTAIITTCTVLGTLHTEQLLKLLEDDLEEEIAKHHRVDIVDDGMTKRRFAIMDIGPEETNEAKLQRSEDKVLTFSKILSICMWLSWLNLIAAAVLIYGVTTNTSVYVIPWLLLSGTTYLLVMTTVIMGYVDMIPGFHVCYTNLLIAIICSLVFMEMWYTIVLYYVSLTKVRCSRFVSSYSPTVIHAYGGYTHTLQPTLAEPEKQPIV